MDKSSIMATKVNLHPILIARISEICHNILKQAHTIMSQFNLIIGTGYDGDLIHGLLSDFFAETNKGKWTPEMVSIMKDCVGRGEYPQPLKIYVKDHLAPTLPSALS